MKKSRTLTMLTSFGTTTLNSLFEEILLINPLKSLDPSADKDSSSRLAGHIGVTAEQPFAWSGHISKEGSMVFRSAIFTAKCDDDKEGSKNISNMYRVTAVK